MKRRGEVWFSLFGGVQNPYQKDSQMTADTAVRVSAVIPIKIPIISGVGSHLTCVV